MKQDYSLAYPQDDSTGFDHLSDGQLWQIFKSGNKAALAYLYQHYFFKLYNYGINLGADEDVVKDTIQELFVYLWKRKGHLSETNSIKHYLYKCLRRKIYAQLKKKQQSLFRQSIPDNYHFEFVLSAEHACIHEQMSAQQTAQLYKALNLLPERQKEILFLRYFEQLSPAEVASVMSLTVNSTYVILSRAISFLRKHVEKIYWFFLISSCLL